jgi:HD-GYP domain-containing protein (c-di-GMP phosphodiesterase class II)
MSTIGDGPELAQKTIPKSFLKTGRSGGRKKADESQRIDLQLVAEQGILGLLAQIVKVIEEKDEYDIDRSPRAYEYAGKIAQALNFSKEHAEIVCLSAVLSNLGKLVVPQEILRKRGPLSDEEMKLIKRTPSIGARLLEPAKIFHRVANVIESYHENWDGSGYPKGLRADEIPMESRIISLVDAYTAMTSTRPYRDNLNKDQVVEIIRAGSGTRWDPRLVKIFLAVLQKEPAENPQPKATNAK